MRSGATVAALQPLSLSLDAVTQQHHDRAAGPTTPPLATPAVLRGPPPLPRHHHSTRNYFDEESRISSRPFETIGLTHCPIYLTFRDIMGYRATAYSTGHQALVVLSSCHEPTWRPVWSLTAEENVVLQQFRRRVGRLSAREQAQVLDPYNPAHESHAYPDPYAPQVQWRRYRAAGLQA